MSEPAIGTQMESRIYDKIFERLCSLLDEQLVGRLRETLRSVITHQDLTAFCNDRNQLWLVDHHATDRGTMRAFRSSVFCVRLKVFAETDRRDQIVRRLRISADIQDGYNTETRPIGDWELTA